MMFHPARVSHTTGRYDHTRLVAEIQQFRLIYCFDIFQPLEFERIIIVCKDLLNVFIEVLRIAP
jgi:hypothetical protein